MNANKCKLFIQPPSEDENGKVTDVCQLTRKHKGAVHNLCFNNAKHYKQFQ